jgi:hypothetical protein
MIRRMLSGNSGHPRNTPVDAPSPEQIKRLTAEIRECWSRKTRAGRAVGSPRHVEIMVVSALVFGDSRGAV